MDKAAQAGFSTPGVILADPDTAAVRAHQRLLLSLRGCTRVRAPVKGTRLTERLIFGSANRM